MDIKREEILKLAELSMLSFSDKEIDSLGKDFREFIVHINEIMKISTISDPSSTNRVNVFREDKVIPKDVELILQQAPLRTSNYFTVPSILETPEE
ncbi:Asp-tRNA(Asn)/Glu-tRNA(Gln) amidotransferase subunit GatC [Candidatus Dependentiae bacterium]|nr:Asp-tRNA(Asn)/Glu-tRNA(Gln) amidotransferase subunit GatC [Candidatus Dependentiae bacterium]